MLSNLNSLLNEHQDPKAVEKIADKLSGILMSGEVVTYIGVQKKPAINISPDCVALTNKRIIFCRPKNLGLSMEFQDYLWKDVSNCHLKEEILGSVFTVKTIKGETNKIDYLPKAQARKLYTISQEEEEKQSEYRRQREMEEKRAGAGHVILNAGATGAQAGKSADMQTEDPLITLQKLKSLLDAGLISQMEFDNKKAEVLKRM